MATKCQGQVVPGPAGLFKRLSAAKKLPCRCSVSMAEEIPACKPARWAGTLEGYWTWRGHTIRYQKSGSSGPAVLLVHGFGGNADHWRKNTAVVGEWGQAFAIDLLGYGYSSKPTPDPRAPNTIYNFEQWANQLEDFIDQVVGEPVHIIANSVGGLPALQTAIQAPTKVKGVQVLNISLRMLHTTKQSPWSRPAVTAFQRALRETRLGDVFFSALAKPNTVKSVLQQAYADPTTVTDELVECILKPGLEPGATRVFLDFISYSTGPLPEDLIAACPVPVSIVWGALDPWEKVEWGRELAKAKTVTEFVELKGVGHCPQDEAPQLVNPLIRRFVETG